jgi:Rnl2 family RNA ligase
MSRPEHWQFAPYEKIGESTDFWNLDENGYRQAQKATWVVTEKIHGANFVCMTDGQIIRYANRKHFLAPDENFFHYQSLIERIQTQVISLYDNLKKSYPAASLIALYGEIFGGSYPHPSVIPVLGVQPIQTGIYYAPGIEFCAFDITIMSEHNRSYVDFDRAISLFQQIGIFYARPLYKGKLNGALEYPLGFTSTIPSLLGLPPLADANKAEGVVIKPLKEILIPTAKGGIRPIIKRKIPEFAEDKRFSQAAKWEVPLQTTTEFPLEMLKWEVFNLVTENRLRSVISKVGNSDGSGKKQQYVFRLFCDDVMEQITLSQSESLMALSPNEQAQLRLYLQSEVRLLLNRYFHTKI